MRTNNYSGRGAVIALGIAAFAFFYPLVPVYANIPGINASVFEVLVRAFEGFSAQQTRETVEQVRNVVVLIVAGGFGIIGLIGSLIGSLFKRPSA